MPSATPLLLRNPLVQQTVVRFRRLMQEGFRGFLVSLSLFTAAAIMTIVYLHDRNALEEAVRNEIIQTVGTRQEPSDSAKELGLIATALAKVNAAPPPSEWKCSGNDQSCTPMGQLPGKLVAATMPEVTKIASDYLNVDGEWVASPSAIDDIYTRKENPEILSWPELGLGPVCEDKGDGTFLMVPAQMRAPHGSHLSPRVAAAAEISGSFFRSLERFLRAEKLAHYVIQVYFISPDSLLRIWSYRHTNVCKEFDKTRLWASKSYFGQFWETEPAQHAAEQYTTLAYIDYGGNGLVRTTCHSIELPRVLPRRSASQAEFPRGHFVGVLCMDFKLPDEQVRLMRRQLFFETAYVNFPVRERSDLDQIGVQIDPPESDSNDRVSAPGDAEKVKTVRILGFDRTEEITHRIRCQIRRKPRFFKRRLKCKTGP